MVKSVFLDTCVFFDCIEKPRYQTTIKYTINLEFKVVTYCKRQQLLPDI